MRRREPRLDPLFVMAACALACTQGAAPAGGAATAKGTYGATYDVIVPRPEHGTVASADGRIRCGTTGDLCGDALFQTAYPWSTVAVTLSFVADDGYHFDGWFGDCRGFDATCTVTRGADRTVAAAFAPDAMYPGVYFAVTIARPVGGAVTGSDPYGFSCAPGRPEPSCGPFPIRWDDAVTLTAAADDGYAFLGWSGACSGKAPCTLTREGATADKGVTARFVDARSLPPLAWDQGNWDEGVWQ